MNKRFISRTTPLLLVLILFFGLSTCGWFGSKDLRPEPTAPAPIGGYEEISKRIYYPDDVRQQEIQGVVEIQAYVDTSGKVIKSEISRSLHPQLDEIARRAIERTAFYPAEQSGIPVPVWIAFPIAFSIEDEEALDPPYELFILEIHPSINYQASEIILQARLKKSADRPHRFEMLTPLTADKVSVFQASEQGMRGVSAKRQLVDLEEWLTCNIDTTAFEVRITTKTIAQFSPDQLLYTVRLNHDLPAWQCNVMIAKEGPGLDFGSNSATKETDDEGNIRYRLDFPRLEAYESQHFEMRLLR